MSDTDIVFQEATSESFATLSATAVEWIWQGYLARGSVTLLTSQWKAGKTTLVSVLLARLASGGQLAGLPVTKSKAAIVSEERLENWRRRGERLAFGSNLVFFCRPFSARPTRETWSRYDDTPRERIFELTADGTDYLESQIDTTQGRAAEYVSIVEHLLTCPPRKLTRMQLLRSWPKGLSAPHPVMLWRALDRAVKGGSLEQDGSGRRSDPFRYSVPG